MDEKLGILDEIMDGNEIYTVKSVIAGNTEYSGSDLLRCTGNKKFKYVDFKTMEFLSDEKVSDIIKFIKNK